MAFDRREYFKKYHQEHREHRLEQQREYDRKHYEEHKVRTSIGMMKMYERKKQIVLDFNIRYLKRHHKFFDGEFHCPKCGRMMKVTQVHNHHVNPDDKLFNISQGVRYSYEVLTEELKKTIPICPDCHKVITAEQRGHRVFNKYNSIPSAELIVKLEEHVPGYKRRR